MTMPNAPLLTVRDLKTYFMMDEGVDRVQATYRDNYKRLAALKAKYDPQNLFRVNQNIKPRG